jgi:catechol 2,3-dioxygenase-like lactoylglutathione lyase family enzyme
VIFGAHVIVTSTDAEADRAFFADVLGFPSVDAGHGWLIFALPPGELAVHPGDPPAHELYLMSDDLPADMDALAAQGVECAAVTQARWGVVTSFTLPGGAHVGLYQPTHPSPLLPPGD